MPLRAHSSGAGTPTETSIAQCMRRSPQEEAAVRTRDQPALRWTAARGVGWAGAARLFALG